MFNPNQQKTSPSDQRNLIIAAVLSFGIIILWQVFYVGPQLEEERAAEAARIEAQERQAVEQAEQAAEIASGAPVEQGAVADATTGRGVFGATPLSREVALDASGQRVGIATPTLEGSIALIGGRLDELLLSQFRTRLDPQSPPVELLWPLGTRNGYFPNFGWLIGGGLAGPSLQSEWALAPGSPTTLTPAQPIRLVWSNGAGQRFVREIAVDDNYMFTITQRIENDGEAPVVVKPYGEIRRFGSQATRSELSGEEFNLAQAGAGWLIHEGPIAVVDGSLEEPDYDDVEDAVADGPGGSRRITYRAETLSWLGFTDKYWMTALAPVGRQSMGLFFDTVTSPYGEPLHRAFLDWQQITVEAGGSHEVSTYFFAGAKEISALRSYAYLIDGATEPTNAAARIIDFFFYSSDSRFYDAIDWGWFFFLTKPIQEILLAIQDVVGNMGISIILLTVLFKLLVFPLAYKSFVSMSKLKKLQPKMKEIQERAGDDRMRMQQEMMELYKTEKVNPAAGCLPILIQIPIFFSLYKVLFISIELRHAPFFGWIQDLSAPDPTSLFNLFGLLPYEVPSLLLIGVWPLLMGFTMWIQQMLNPAPTDPIQEKIFALLPILFTFMLASFASGLVIYWTANNLFTIIQQYFIMKNQGVEINLLDNMKRQLGLAKKEKPT